MRACFPLALAAELQAVLCRQISPVFCLPHLFCGSDVLPGSDGVHEAAHAEGKPPGGGDEGRAAEGRG